MTEVKEKEPVVRQAADGIFEQKFGNTTYKVKVFFDHDSQMSAEERLKRTILADVSKEA